MAAAAYAALLALARSLQDILDLQQYVVDPLHKEKILSLHEKVDFIITFLEDYSDKYHETLGRVGNGIRKAAYIAQDFMDSYYCYVSKSTYDYNWSYSDANLDQDLIMALKSIDFIWEETMKMKNGDTTTSQDHPSVSYINSSPVHHSSTAKKMVVGFDDDLNAIKEWLCEDSSKLQIIPIVGMGGIGKTTLARRAFEDLLSSQYFDICAWITVSQEYQRREILSGLFKSLTKSDNDQSNESEAQLAKLVYQNLVGRRYLMVVDDVWSAKAWDDLKMIFPNDGRGSRILLTTRILDVAAHAGSSSSTLFHQMKYLNEDQSWTLLQERVFGQQSACPDQLVEVGKKIAKNCGGLPLTIVVVGGLLLSSGNVKREEVWENISENISSREPTIALQCSKILCFSYDRLPLRLKPCFLYIAAFPEDSEIVVSKLIKLWVAEGFLKPNDQSKCLEDVGERYLEDLVNRSLLLVSKKGPDGKLETVGIHDMLREICITKAEEEGFLHQVSPSTEFTDDPYRRLKIWSTDYIYRDWKITGIVHESDLQTIETVSNFIFAEETIKILVNLKKLKCSYTLMIRNRNWDGFNLNNLFHLQNLEDLQISVRFNSSPSMIWNHAFPIGLKKLSLKGVPFPWENMTIIGSLPNLQVLEMIEIEVTKVSEWTTVEGQFLQLKYFRSSLNNLAKWETEKEHFPCLESLILERAMLFNKIPSCIGEIDTLQYIELQYCEKSLVHSVKQIQRLQHKNGNDAFRVRVIGPRGYNVLF